MNKIGQLIYANIKNTEKLEFTEKKAGTDNYYWLCHSEPRSTERNKIVFSSKQNNQIISQYR